MGNFRLFGMNYAICKLVCYTVYCGIHFKFVTHTITIVHLNYCMHADIFQHLHISYYYVYNTVQYF